MLLISYGAGGVGLNLQFAEYVFLFDRWWNPAVEDQAINRAHRIGAAGPVTVTRFLAVDTIEQRIDQVLREKREIFDTIFSDVAPHANLGLTQQEIFGLFKLKMPERSEVRSREVRSRAGIVPPRLSRLRTLDFGTPDSYDGGMTSHYDFDVLVIGAGHAGTEAALAAARLGAKTALLTTNCDTVGQMSCNPAIGGVAKGQIVREIDALGGAMGQAIDATGIQFRMLNRRKGPAMHSPRAQADKKAYQHEIKRIVEEQPDLTLRQEVVEDLLVEEGRPDSGRRHRAACARARRRRLSGPRAWCSPPARSCKP